MKFHTNQTIVGKLSSVTYQKTERFSGNGENFIGSDDGKYRI